MERCITRTGEKATTAVLILQTKLKTIEDRFEDVELMFKYELSYLIWLYQKSARLYTTSKKTAKKRRQEGGTSMALTGKQMQAISN